jgi:hypothetical protein
MIQADSEAAPRMTGAQPRVWSAEGVPRLQRR